MTTETDLTDRAAGALLGLACGDAVGTTLEFLSPGTFDPIDDMVGGGTFNLRPGEWTDDTSMALCLAESLLDVGSMDLADQLRRYLLWRDEGHLSSNGRCFDIGLTTRSQLDRFRRTGDPVDPNPNQEAAANGSLMRLAPVPIRWHANIAEAAFWSAESSRSTHAADRPVDACRLLGAMTAALIQGVPADDVLAPGFWQWGALHPEIEAIARGSWRDKEPPAIRGSGYCVAALKAAIWAVAGADDFRSAVLRAANLGDDADTTAAIAGQLAGARWGATGIPVEWRRQLVLGDRIETMATRLAVAGGAQPSPIWEHDETVHAWWVDVGELLAGEYPGNRKPARARHKLDLLVDAGVRTFIDLTTPEDRLEPYLPILQQVGEARALDRRHAPFPIPDLGVLDDHLYDDVVSTIQEAKAEGAVYVHCWGGVGRTGTVIGCLLADRGHSCGEVAARLARLRTGTRKGHRRCPENDLQLAVIERRARRS